MHDGELKRELVERSLQPGASVSAIALENGLNANLLFKWRRKHLRDARASARDESEHGNAQSVLLPVEIAQVPMAAPMPPTSTPRASTGVIEIDIGAARVRLRGAIDEANLRCVLHALRSVA
jgi:transposase